MGELKNITAIERAAAMCAAVNMARDMVRDGSGYLSPRSMLGSMSQYEWDKLAEAIVSGWIIERSRQLTGSRFTQEAAFLAMGEDPEPAGLGHCAAILPALGELCEARGLTGKPIGDWSKMDVLIFVWNIADMMTRATVARDERPEFVPADQVLGQNLLMAG